MKDRSSQGVLFLEWLQRGRSPSILIRSPAKVNLRLEVLARRPDGYHDIRSVMVPVGLFDLLHIVLTEKEGIHLSCSQQDLPVDERNLAFRAGLLMLEAAGKRQGVEIRIEKRIPVAAGLGGGSSNAAATLVGLNRLLKTNLSRVDLMAMAGELGADVPFFVFGRPALATGIGGDLEQLTRLPRLWFLLVYPGISISTKWAYEKLNFRLTKRGDHINMPTFFWDIGNLAGLLRNDLERAVLQEYPVLEGIKKSLLRAGAVGALMSGSGSTVYGLFLAKEKAKDAYGELKEEFGKRDWEIFLTQNIGS